MLCNDLDEKDVGTGLKREGTHVNLQLIHLVVQKKLTYHKTTIQ